MSVYHPHDRTFRNAMKDIQVAREFFQNYLPENIRSIVDLNKLIVKDNTYIDPKLRECRSDILYQTVIDNNPGFLYLLIEHFSSAKVLTPFSLLQYQVGIWSDFIKEQPDDVEKLPLIIPMVFYNGTRPYDKPRNLRQIIAGPPELIDQILFNDFHLIDTNLIEDETLRNQLWSGILTFTFKHVRDRNIKNAFREFCKKALFLFENHGERSVPLVELLLQYQSIVGRWDNPEEMLEIADMSFINSKRKGNVMSTLAEYLGEIGREKGVQQGIQQGRQLGESELLLRLLNRKFGIIPTHYRKKIEQADANTLLIWGERILEAQNIEDIFVELVSA